MDITVVLGDVEFDRRTHTRSDFYRLTQTQLVYPKSINATLGAIFGLTTSSSIPSNSSFLAILSNLSAFVYSHVNDLWWWIDITALGTSPYQLEAIFGLTRSSSIPGNSSRYGYSQQLINDRLLPHKWFMMMNWHYCTWNKSKRARSLPAEIKACEFTSSAAGGSHVETALIYGHCDPRTTSCWFVPRHIKQIPTRNTKKRHAT